MKIHIYTNNAHDTVALINDDNQVVSHWDPSARGDIQRTVLEEALFTNDVNDWADQGHEIDVDDFEEGQDLFLVILEDGEWEVEDRGLLESRLSFHLSDDHPIVKALKS